MVKENLNTHGFLIPVFIVVLILACAGTYFISIGKYNAMSEKFNILQANNTALSENYNDLQATHNAVVEMDEATVNYSKQINEIAQEQDVLAKAVNSLNATNDYTTCLAIIDKITQENDNDKRSLELRKEFFTKVKLYVNTDLCTRNIDKYLLEYQSNIALYDIYVNSYNNWCYGWFKDPASISGWNEKYYTPLDKSWNDYTLETDVLNKNYYSMYDACYT